MKSDQNDPSSTARHWWRREPITLHRVACLRGPGWIVDGVLREAHALHKHDEVRRKTGRPSTSSAHRILLVDDDRDLRELYSIVLRSLGGYRVTTASNAADALAKARRLVPDAIVTDFSMPVMDGGQLADRLAADERTRRIPIVMISGFAEDVPDPVRRSCAAFLPKPCDPEELSRVVTLVVAARGLV